MLHKHLSLTPRCYTNTSPSLPGATQTPLPHSTGATQTPLPHSTGATQTPLPHSTGAIQTLLPHSTGATQTPFPHSTGATQTPHMCTPLTYIGQRGQRLSTRGQLSPAGRSFSANTRRSATHHNTISATHRRKAMRIVPPSHLSTGALSDKDGMQASKRVNNDRFVTKHKPTFSQAILFAPLHDNPNYKIKFAMHALCSTSPLYRSPSSSTKHTHTHKHTHTQHIHTFLMKGLA